MRQEKETKKYKIWKVEMAFCLEENASPNSVQENVGDVVGFIPDHCTKANTAIKQTTWVSGFSSTYTSYVYSML